MQYMILMLFGVLFALGIYMILAHLFHIPTLKKTKAVMRIGKKKQKQTKDSDAFIMELALKIAPYIPVDSHRKRKLTSTLKSAEMNMTAEVYLAQAYVKTGLALLGIVPCLLIVPIFSPVFLIMAIGVYFSETTKADKMVKVKRDEIEYELPRFVATLTQSLAATRDLRTILETYMKNAGSSLKHELMITTADMGTGNYQSALTRLDTRVSSGTLSQVVAGLQGVVNGDDGVAHFKMLSHDMKLLELQRLKRLAMERPPKIRKYSFFLLACMLMIYMGVMGYQVLGTMSGMF